MKAKLRGAGVRARLFVWDRISGKRYEGEEVLVDGDDDIYEDEDDLCDGDCENFDFDCDADDEDGEEDDGDYFEVVCPSCGDVINFDSSIDPENLRCPNCGEKFECIVDEDDLKALDGDDTTDGE